MPYYTAAHYPIRKCSDYPQKGVNLYIRKNYKYSAVQVTVDKAFKSAMNRSGELYGANERLSLFPAVAAALLKSKKHEWVIIALESNLIVKYFWANKGNDNTQVAATCSTSYIISLCKKHNCHTVLWFHNHPNAILSPSKQDMISAKSISSAVNPHGINFVDFVCGRWRFYKYYESFSPTFYPDNAIIETIQTENRISAYKNYKLHRELGIITRGYF